MIEFSKIPDVFGITLIDEFTVRKEAKSYSSENMMIIREIIKFYERNPDKHVIRAWNFNFIGNNSYTYDMERATALTLKEKQIVSAVSERSYYDHITSAAEAIKICYSDKAEYIIADNQKLINFLDYVINQNRYHDLHDQNVMRSIDNEFVLIDLEGFTFNKKISEYDWITDIDMVTPL
jgi:hypothetical protein